MPWEKNFTCGEMSKEIYHTYLVAKIRSKQMSSDKELDK